MVIEKSGPAKIRPSVRDLEWAAGFIEGEGSVSCSANSSGTFYARIQANQADRNPHPIYRLREMFGGGIYDWTSDNRLSKTKMLMWCATGSRAVGVMQTLLPLVSPLKQEQIVDCLNRHKTRAVV